MFQLVILFILLSSILNLFAIEQSIIIDLGRNPSEYQHKHGFKNPYKYTTNSGSRKTDRNNDRSQYGTRPVTTFENKTPFSVRLPTRDLIPSSLEEKLLRQMDHVFTNRIESLSQRVDRLESKPNRLDSAMHEFISLSLNNDKQIYFYQNTRNTWDEAKEICRLHSSTLLTITTENENRQISGKKFYKIKHILELIKNEITDDISKKINSEQSALYWIGKKTILEFPIDYQKYNNFETVYKQKDFSHLENSFPTPSRDTIYPANVENMKSLNTNGTEMCIAISIMHGKWSTKDCEEKLGFICQI